MRGVVTIIEFCEECQGYRTFVRPKHSDNTKWKCSGRSSKHFPNDSDTDCGYETNKFREYTNNFGMAH